MIAYKVSYVDLGGDVGYHTDSYFFNKESAEVHLKESKMDSWDADGWVMEEIEIVEE